MQAWFASAYIKETSTQVSSCENCKIFKNTCSLQNTLQWMLLHLSDRPMLFELYYVFIISDRFLVRSITIHHILQPSGNRNVVGSIRHVSCFHLEWHDKIIKIVYYVIHINFLIKSTDSCWELIRGQHKTSRKIYIKLRSTVKNLALKKIKTKNILANSQNWQEKVLQNFSGLTMISSY